ncbi:MAG: 3'(2'),5'-bisphosphate nucleotidase CysQ [Acidimicrobiia bacterium]|nr:3'(2'),5'-bisphosphate nucleotidase CysQ [Acidimicrobiia bacterium]MYB24083.1 3'(2'),5'-bisphosphate nucleotidase CysQ [Acidimicrobiia bacterium]MYE66877.1 3'(2'),5'-bisphosphate nucleotidase CysQ [Acidimicrobiia bacterium]MYJ13614.1 3'(2'),5'-bisphosphate nucleotidase CysQ [Acidimicrobiia bacterium]
MATDLATRAGTLLVALRRQHRFEDAAGQLARPGGRHPEDGGGAAGLAADALRAEGDRLAHDYLAGALAEARPGDALLSEEAPDDLRRLHAERVWIVDPLDGTRQYGEAGRSDWAVHVALVIGGVPTVGAVALPAEGVTLCTADPPPLPPATASGRGVRRRRVITSRSRPGADARAVAAALDAELVTLGSVGVKVAQVIRGAADAYVHSGGQSEWDSAAPVAVALACGLHASRLDGRPLRYNRPDVELPDLLICRHEIAAAALAAAHLGTPPSGPS